MTRLNESRALRDPATKTFVDYCMPPLKRAISTGISMCKFQINTIRLHAGQNRKMKPADFELVKNQLRMYVTGEQSKNGTVPMAVYLHDPNSLLLCTTEDSLYGKIINAPHQYPEYNLETIRRQARLLFTPFIDNITFKASELLESLQALEAMNENTLFNEHSVPFLNKIIALLEDLDAMNQSLQNEGDTIRKHGHRKDLTPAIMSDELRVKLTELMRQDSGA